VFSPPPRSGGGREGDGPARPPWGMRPAAPSCPAAAWTEPNPSSLQAARRTRKPGAALRFLERGCNKRASLKLRSPPQPAPGGKCCPRSRPPERPRCHPSTPPPTVPAAWPRPADTPACAPPARKTDLRGDVADAVAVGVGEADREQQRADVVAQRHAGLSGDARRCCGAVPGRRSMSSTFRQRNRPSAASIAPFRERLDDCIRGSRGGRCGGESAPAAGRELKFSAGAL
jgi:hypothetical protein